MKRKRISRMLAVLLAFVMVFTLIPSTALAEGENSNSTSAYWPNFRGNDCNMAIVDAQTPIDINKTSKLWGVKLSSSWSEYVSPQIVVGEYIYATVGTSIKKIEKANGNVVKTGTMAGDQGWASSTSPIYADGKIIVALTGKIQAFDADTLESIWTYTDELGGQCQSPLTYSDGCVYTGFYNSGNANFVCIDVSDEDVTNGVKTSKWKYMDSCDFYWDGSAIVGNAVVVGTQDKTLLSLNKNTGDVISKIEGIGGEIRSSIAYEKESGNIFFTAKGGYIYKAKVDFTTGKLSNLSGVIPTGEDNSAVISDSVSTPVVYDGKIYFVGGTGWGNPGKLCIVNSDDLSLISEVQIGNNPQCSILLSTAYKESGYLYLYATYNDNPGGITMIKVPTNIDDSNQPEVVELFTPSTDEQQYCICSIICDENGTLYYKNDSGFLFAINLNENAVAERKEEAISLLDSYNQENYYETQWSDITSIINEAKTTINGATTINEVNVALDTAKNKIALIETKQNFKENITIYVTIADKGQIVFGSDNSKTILADAAVAITDTNNDGKHTADEVFTQLHEKYCEAGIDGYVTTQYDWGTGIIKFWNESTTAVGYYINDICANGLGDILKDGDYLTAFIYKDQTGWSDAYSLFDKNVYTAELNKEITLTLTELKYGVPEEPCSGASIKVIGSNNNVVPKTTDNSGEVSLKFEAAGTYKVMAYKDDGSIVPAVATVTVTGTGTVAPPTEQNAKVTFTLKGDTVHSGSLHSGTYYPTWIPATTVELSDSIKTVGDVFKKVLDANGYTYVGLNAGYISSITTPSGLKLAEFDNGEDSGWMYMVNGSHPNVGLNDYVLSNGDVIVWHYTDNYKEEHDYAGPKGDQSSVTTTGTSGSAVTTTPTEVTVSGSTATATVKRENAAEAIKQAKENKSAEIVLNVAASDTKGAETVKLQLDTATVKSLVNDTQAVLIVKTENGQVSLDREALSTIASEATGTTITLEVIKVTNPTEVQKKAAGTNGYVIRLVIKSGDKIISDFNKGKATVTVEIPANLHDKKVAAIYIADDGQIEQLTGKTVKIDGKDYYTFETPHFSAFALVDAEELGLEVNDEEANIERIKELVSSMSLKARSSKTSKKNIKVTLTVDDSTAATIKEIKEMGYTVKYKYYRSTRKASKYQAKITKTTKSFINTAGKKGTKYYYKARIQVYDKDGKLVAQTLLKQCKYAARTWTK